MKKLVFTILTFVLSSAMLKSQVSDSITLQHCYQMVYKNFPLAKQFEMLRNTNLAKKENIGKTYLPQLNINAQTSYQSDVTTIPFSIPNMPKIDAPSNDQYKLALDINQVIYDGGYGSNQKKIEDINLKVDSQAVTVELYKLKDRVNQLYFAILLYQENEKILNLLKDELKNKLKTIESRIKEGIMLKTNADILNAEMLKLEQQILEVNNNKKSAIEMLAELTDVKLNENSKFKISKENNNISTNISRPENILFELQRKKIDISQNAIKVKTLPRLYCFGQLGYGRPSFNMFLNEFDTYYIFGAKLSWNVFDWNQNKNERKVMKIQSDMITLQKEVFDKNLKIAIIKQQGEVAKAEEMIANDENIIKLRTNIANTYSSQLENGVITSTEYVTELNNLTQSKLNLETHKIQLEKAKIDLLNLVGN